MIIGFKDGFELLTNVINVAKLANQRIAEYEAGTKSTKIKIEEGEETLIASNLNLQNCIKCYSAKLSR